MKKFFTKFSLLSIGLLLCIGNAWATGTYHDPANPNSGQDYDCYYEETIGGITYRIDYTYRYTDHRQSPQLPNYYTIKRTPVTQSYPYEEYTYQNGHAYVTSTFNGSSPAELELANSLTIVTTKMVNDMVPGNPTFNFETTTAFPVCLKKSNFDGYSGKIKLPAFPEDGKAIVLEGWSVVDMRYEDSNYGDAFTYILGNNLTVEVPTFEDQAKYEAQTITYKGTALNSGGWGTNTANFSAYPWNGHLTNRGEIAPFDYQGGGTDGTISWTILSGKLSVLGSGAIPDYNQGGAPWYSYADKIFAIEIGEDITAIGGNAFYGLSNVTNVIFKGNKITTIGEYAFWGPVVRKIVFPTGITTINGSIFSSSRELISATIPATVTTMAQNALGSYALRNITLLNANPTNTINAGALNGTYSGFSLSINIPENAVCAYTGLFGKKTYTSVETGETVECTDPIPFADGLYYQFNDGALTISGDGTTIPDYDYYGVNQAPWISDATIKNNITSIVFETTNLETIGNYAFYQCTNAGFTSITIPNTVTTLRGNVFNGCSHLATVTLGSSVTSVGSNVFKSCPLTSPVYNSHIFVLMPNAYFTTQGVDSYDIPNVETIASSAFSGCSNMHSVTIPNTVTSIGSSVFSSTGLTSMPEFPKTITAMPEWAFQSCTGLTNVEIPTQFTSISRSAFYGCSNLESVTIPNSVTSIGSNAFYGCNQLTSVTIPNSVTLIDGYAFQNCSKLASIDIPSSVTTMGYTVFRGCSALTSVKLPAGLTEIKNFTFRDCSALSNLYIKGTSMATIGMNAFQNCTQAITIHVPHGTGDAYTTMFSGSSNKPSNYTILEDNDIYVFTDDAASSTEATLENLVGNDLETVTTVRPVQQNNQYNTLCLPFSMDEDQIAKSSLATAEIYQFSGVTKNGDELDLYFQPTTTITAGVPYFFRYAQEGDILSLLGFENITVTTATAGSITYNGVTLIGTLSQVSVSGSNKLYLAANNELHWSSSAKTINPFRAYFSVAGLPAGAPPRARIVEREAVATDIESAQTSAISSQKVIENGQLYIIRNGVRYNAAGRVVK